VELCAHRNYRSFAPATDLFAALCSAVGLCALCR